VKDEKLLSWIRNESSSNDDINWSVTIDTHPKTKLRGLYATKHIRPNELIVEVPYHMALLVGDNLRKRDQQEEEYYQYVTTTAVVKKENEWMEDNVEDVLQGLYFLKNFVSGGTFDNNNNNNGDDEDTMTTSTSSSSVNINYYSPYVTTLPPKPTTTINNNNNNNNIIDNDTDEGLTPDFWSTSIIQEIGIPTYIQRILHRKHIIQSIAQRAHVNTSDLQWATFLVRSRRFTTWNMVPDPTSGTTTTTITKNVNAKSDEEEKENGGGGLFNNVLPKLSLLLGSPTTKKIEQIQGFLIPLIDMANHHPNPNAIMKISVNKWTRQFDESSTFALRATRSIGIGEEITISYGDGSGTCLEMLDKYGFFVENDDDDDAAAVDERGVDLNVLKPTWRTSLEEDQVELDRLLRRGSSGSSVGGKDSASSKLKTILSRLQDEYTFNFPPTLLQNNEQMKLIGSGIREKMGIQVYAVGMYGAPTLLDAVSPSDLRYKARQFDASSSSSSSSEEENSDRGMTSFVLEMILQAEGKVIAEAIADSVGVRYNGPRTDVEQLKNLIRNGISGTGGQANKGTTLRFDCMKEGVSLSVDGVERGMVKASGIGRAFVDVYLDYDAVSPSLIDSCMENTSMADNAVNEDANISDVSGSASRRTMLSLRIWLKRLKEWTKPEGASAVASNGVDASDGGNTGFISEVQGAEQRDSFDEDSTEKVEDIVVAVAELSSGDITCESTSDKASSDDVVAMESIAIGSTLAAGQSIEEDEQPAVAQTPEATTLAVSSKNIGGIESDLGSGLTELPRVDTTPVQPMQAASVRDKSDFDANKIAARIRELEEEIAAEIIRVKSQQGAPTSDGAISQETLTGVRVSSPGAETNPTGADEQAAAVESKVKSLKEKATGVSFDPKLEDRLFLVGAGVRKKAIINVYAVAMYSSPVAIPSVGSMKKGRDAQSALRDLSRTFNSLTPKTSFVLEMTFKADGKTIAEAIADGVKPRHSGSAADVTQLENLIVEGVKGKGGQATKGTIFRFDCDAEGVAVSVDGNMQGKVASEGMGSAFVDVFMDDKAVSPQLVDSCLDTWCGSGL